MLEVKDDGRTVKGANFKQAYEIGESDKVKPWMASQFKSVLGNNSFTQGERHRFDIRFEVGNNFKVGVAQRGCNVNLAFSDCSKGWAYYSFGYLRHNSGGEGPKYGESYEKGSVVSVYLDLVDGLLFFGKNGKVFPIAYKQDKFLKLDLYPACALFLEGEQFSIIPPYPED